MVHCDILIRGGIVIDGTGDEPRTADIAVRDGLLIGVDPGLPFTPDMVIDARRKVVCPGFIDVHSHADFTIAGHPAADTALSQGVTTLVTGNCGWSPFPRSGSFDPSERCAFFQPTLEWDYRDAASYAEGVDSAGPAVNIVLQIGHTALRAAVMGDVADPPSQGELHQMQGLLQEAAAQGVHGFSTGLVYAPGAHATATELRTLVRTAASCGLVYSTHVRDESDRLLDAVSEAIAIAAQCGARLQISHLKAMGRPNHGKAVKALRLIDDAYRQGLDVGCDVYPYTTSCTTLMSRLPAWALADGVDVLRDRLADADTRQRVTRDLQQRLRTSGGAERIVLASVGDGDNSGQVGRSLAAIAAGQATTAEDVAIGLVLDHGHEALVLIDAMAEDDMTSVLRHPRACVASDGWIMNPKGDGLAHPRNFGSFSRVLARYVRQRSLLTLAEAVRKMSSLPAERIGLRDRGILRPGAVADVVVLDFEQVEDVATFDAPWQLATGVSDVVMSGRHIVRDGVRTGARVGRVLRRSCLSG